jgi:VIT1/CCC1 family predicted Fe2+/Mn2+ transporter
MFLVRSVVARGRERALGRVARAAGTGEVARRLIADEIGPMAAGLDAAALERMRQWLAAQPTAEVRLTGRDYLGAAGVFLLVFVSTFPVVLPFMFVDDLRLAMRLSSAIAIAIVFRCGYLVGRHAELAPWRSGWSSCC